MAAIKTIKKPDGSRLYGCQVRVKGFKPVYKSFPTRAECVEWRDTLTRELKKQRERGETRPDLPTLTLAALNAAYLADPVTAGKKYHRELTRSLGWWTLHHGTVKVREFGPLQGRAARDALMVGRKNATVDRILSAERSAWNWGREAGLIATDHAWPPGLFLAEPRARVRYLSDSELSSVLTAARAQSAVLHAALVVAIGTGVRKGELLRLTWRDVDLERARVTILESKNNERRTVHLPPTAVAVLRELKSGPVVAMHVFVGPDGAPLTWNQLDKSWRVARTAAGLKDFRWHDLRHTAASYLAQHGATLLEIGSVLGHKSPSITAKYAHLVQGAPLAAHAGLDEKLRGA